MVVKMVKRGTNRRRSWMKLGAKTGIFQRGEIWDCFLQELVQSLFDFKLIHLENGIEIKE